MKCQVYNKEIHQTLDNVQLILGNVFIINYSFVEITNPGFNSLTLHKTTLLHLCSVF